MKHTVESVASERVVSPQELLGILHQIGIPKEAVTEELSEAERRELQDAQTVNAFAEKLGVSPAQLLSELDDIGVSKESVDTYVSVAEQWQLEVAQPLKILACDEGVAVERLLRKLEETGRLKPSVTSLVTAEEQDQLATFARVHRTAETIRAIREYRGLTRDYVAAGVGVSERQLAKIEAGEVDLIDDENPKQAAWRKKLANVLGVEIKDLSGRTDTALQILDSDTRSESTAAISAMVTPHARTGFARIRNRYGWSMAQVLELSPLMFVLLAEGSLFRRRKRLQKMRSALDEVPFELHRFLSELRGRLEGEEGSIQHRNLRHESFSGGASLDPFSAYVFELARNLGDDALVPVPPAGERLLLDWLLRDELRCRACRETIKPEHVHCPWCGERTGCDPSEG